MVFMAFGGVLGQCRACTSAEAVKDMRARGTGGVKAIMHNKNESEPDGRLIEQKRVRRLAASITAWVIEANIHMRIEHIRPKNKTPLAALPYFVFGTNMLDFQNLQYQKQRYHSCSFFKSYNSNTPLDIPSDFIRWNVKNLKNGKTYTSKSIPGKLSELMESESNLTDVAETELFRLTHTCSLHSITYSSRWTVSYDFR